MINDKKAILYTTSKHTYDDDDDGDDEIYEV